MFARTRWTGVLIAVLVLGLLVVAGHEALAQRIARNESLNVAIGSRIPDPTNLNLYAPGVSRSSTGLHQVVYEYFFYYNLETGEYIPWLAESYRYGPGYGSITVKIRNGVEWNDGRPFTADDVVFTYNLLLANPAMTWAAEVAKWVRSVEKVDSHTVTIHLKEANPRFHLIREAFPAVGIWGGLTILPKHVWEGQDPLTFKNSNPVATGPYKLLRASETAIIYERNDNWWGSKVFGRRPAPRYVSFQYVGPETSTAIALTANDLDTPNIGILSAGTFREIAARNPTVRAWHQGAPYAWLDPCPRAFMVQNATAPWDKKEARWALSYLLNRDAIVSLAYEDTTVPSWGIWPFYGGLQPYFDAIGDLLERYPTTKHDAAKAEELLRSIGYRKAADGSWTAADGTKLSVTYHANSGSAEEMKVSAVVADQLRAFGIDVRVQSLAGAAQEDARLRGQWDIAFQPFCPGEIFDNLELFHSKYYVQLGERAPWYERNSFRYRNSRLDAIVDQMAAIPPDQVDRIKTLYRQAMEIWLDELPVVPGVQAPALVPFSNAYWQGWPSADNPWNMPVSWWATFNLVINGYPSPTTGQWVGGIRPTGRR